MISPVSGQPDLPARRARIGARLATVAVVLLSLGLIAGCGGSDEEDLTRTDYIADADAICAQYGAQSADLERQFDQALRDSDLEGAAQTFEDQASEVTAMLDQLEELTPPVADQATVDQIISLGRQRVEAAKDAANAIASGDKDAMIAAGKEGSVLAGEYYQLADGFGFEACGSGGATSTPATPTGTTGATS